MLSADEFAQRADNFYEETVAKVYAAYEQRKRDGRRAGLRRPDHGDRAAVPRHPEVLRHYQERFRYILVDEYQDTNRAQYQLVNLLAARYRNLCVVGDADQGVYSWRGATIQNLLDFERDYPDAAVFLMEQNYRSTQNILAIANALIEHNVAAQAEEPVDRDAGTATSRCGSAPTTSTRRPCSSPRRSSACRRARAYRYRDVAVFYRTNAQTRVLEDVFMRTGVPYQVVRRRAVLPAQGDQGRAGVPAAAGQPAGRRSASAASSTRRSAGSATPRWRRVESFARTEGIPFIEASAAWTRS